MSKTVKIVNILQYGDEGTYVALTMIAPDDLSKGNIRRIVKMANAYFQDTNNSEEVIEYLKGYGFVVCADYEVTIGGNL